VSRPVRVVAPTSVNGTTGSANVLAYGPSPVVTSILKSSIAGYRLSSTAGVSLWISSMKSTSDRFSLVSRPASAPLCSTAGPEVAWTVTPISWPMM